MAQKDVDVLMSTGLPTLAYTGHFYQSLAWYVNTAVLLGQNGASQVVLPVADVSRVAHETWIENIVPWNPAMFGRKERLFEQVVADFINSYSGRASGKVRVGIEANLGWRGQKALADLAPNAEWVAADDLLTDLMIIKEEEEIARMRKVASMCDVGFEAGLAALKSRSVRTEVQLVGVVEKAMRDVGCEGYWVPNQAGTGKTVLLDHYPTSARIEPDHIVKFGCHPQFMLYRGDTCNTVALSRPEPEFERLARVCADATRDCIERLGPGVVASEVYDAFRRPMQEAGYEEYCTWYIGHGLGTGHQPPFVSPQSAEVLKPGMIVVINTMAVKEGRPGVVYETMCLIDDTGYEVLNKNPMELVVLED
jgi:Xaa-Pro dipeptidase